jgi:peptidoglycan/LPS O-acetylase OafA/YrhL
MSNSSSNLDQLRAIAVATVMVDHLIPTMVHHGVEISIFTRDITEHIGHAGVMAFFVHTSLVLMYSLERMTAQQAEGVVPRFYLRRAFRIYPLSIACILAVLAFGLPDATWRPATDLSMREVLANLFLVQNLVTGQSVLVPMWSLPYEVQMYFVLPFFFLLARRINGLWIIGATLAVSYVGAYVLFKLDGGHMNLAGYVPCFLAGVLCYTLRNKVPAFLPGRAWPIFVLLLVSGFCYMQLDSHGVIYWLGWLFALLIGVSINLFRDSDQKWFNKLCLQIATYSYGLYLLHVPCLYVVYDIWRPSSPIVGVLAFVALSCVAAVAAYHLIEAPMVNLGRRLTERRHVATPVAAT